MCSPETGGVKIEKKTDKEESRKVSKSEHVGGGWRWGGGVEGVKGVEVEGKGRSRERGGEGEEQRKGSGGSGGSGGGGGGVEVGEWRKGSGGSGGGGRG